MNILHLAYCDNSGVPSRWAQAHRDYGHQATLCVERDHEYRYKGATATLRWSHTDQQEIVEPLLERADAIMAYDHPFYLETALQTGKPVMFRALGHAAREHADRLRELLREPNVVRATVGLPDLALALDAELIGAPYPLLEPANPDGLTVCHSPSNRNNKGTAIVVWAVKGTPCSLDIVEREANHVVLKHKRRATIVVDSFSEFGYGVNAIEAMAMGLPAVAYARPEVKEMWKQKGSPVVLVDGPDELRAAITKLAEDDDLRERLREKGRAWVLSFHSGADRAREDTGALLPAAVAA